VKGGHPMARALSVKPDGPERRVIFEKIMAWTIDDIEYEISAEMKNFSRMAPGGNLTGFCGGSNFLKMIYQYEGNWNE